MDRKNTYFGQLVTEADVDEWFDDAENALWNLAIDIGLLGVKEGAVLTETATPSMYIEASSSCRAYDQAGKRIYYGPTQTIDCSQDELGNPTIPAAGKERVIMIELKFKRLLSDLRTDDNGASVYYDRAESFEINVVAGAEVTAPASYPGDAPTAPSDALILGDIILQNGTTVINTSDIKLDRRQDFVWTQAENIGVTAGSWAKIDSTSDHVQDALDSVDTELISRDASGYVDQDLLADGTVDLGSSSQPWGAIWHKGDIRHDGSGTPVVGDATNHYNNGHFDSLKIYTQLEAHTGSPPLGDATNRFDAHLNAATVYTGIAASATGKYLGSASAQFNLFSNLITHYGALKGTVNFNTAKQIVVRIPLGTVIPTGNWGFAAVYYQNTTSTESLYYYFTVPEDVSLDAVRIRWYEATSANMAATLESLDEDNSPTTVAGPTTIGGFDANRWDSIGGGSLAEVIDRTTTTYRVKALTGSTNTQRVLGLELTLDVTDILAAALGSC